MSGIAKAADYIIAGAADSVIVVSNVVWREDQGWYFTVSSSDVAGEWHVDMIYAGKGYDTADKAQEMRGELLTALVATEKPLVIHDMGDELQAALLCQTLWPGERIDNVCKQMLADRIVN